MSNVKLHLSSRHLITTTKIVSYHIQYISISISDMINNNELHNTFPNGFKKVGKNTNVMTQNFHYFLWSIIKINNNQSHFFSENTKQIQSLFLSYNEIKKYFDSLDFFTNNLVYFGILIFITKKSIDLKCTKSYARKS